jgi:(p)ppGpp synthase/HD superfamily hydrolase
MSNLGKAIAIAAKAFENKTDKGGKPYILHCLYVMHKVKHLGETAMICAVLHDLVEDCEKEGYDWLFLQKEGFSQEVRNILLKLTHFPNEEYMDYIKQLANNPIAKAIKMADLEHNSKLTRIKDVRKKDFDRMEKYVIAFKYLSE